MSDGKLHRGRPPQAGDNSPHTVLPEHKENAMNTKSTLKIELTPEQKQQTEQMTGKQIPAVKLNLETLEERVVPFRYN
jgi:hypothetical protein